MKKQLKQSEVRRFLCVSILIIGISIFSSMRTNATTVSYDPLSNSSFTQHDPISITSDSGLEVFPGSGTEEDPYVIDGPAGGVDLYPLDELVEYSTDETQLNFAFTLLISVVTLMLTRTISKKKKKKNESDRLNVF